MHEQYLHHFGMALLGCQEDGRGAILQTAWGNVVLTAVTGAEDVQKVGMSWQTCYVNPAGASTSSTLTQTAHAAGSQSSNWQ